MPDSVQQTPPPASRHTYAALTLASLALIAGLACLLATIVLWYRLHLHMPWRDMYLVMSYWVPLLENGAGEHWLAELFSAHYSSHRITLPRLIIAADLLFGNGQNQWFYFCGWLAAFAMLLMYVSQSQQAPTYQRLFLAGIALCFLFGPSQLWNFINPINLSWHITLALAMAAFLVLLKPGTRIQPHDWILAYLLASLAAFTTFGGVIAWLLLPLAGARRTGAVPLAALFSLSVLFAVLYSWNLQADADIAMRWTQGNPDAIAQVQELASAAIASSNPLSLSWGAAQMLSWPLSEGQAGLGASLTLISSLLFLLPLWQLVSSRRGTDPPPTNWSLFCLCLAALCVGLALATQMGRLLEQPNYIHGPSFERYQTIVGLYWMAFFGLFITEAPRLRNSAAWQHLAACLGLTWLLMVPGGHYLEQEIENISSAKRIFAQGEQGDMPAARNLAKLHAGPQFIYSFDDFLRARQLAYHRGEPSVTTAETLACEASGVHLEWQANGNGDQELRLQLPWRQFAGSRELWLSSHQALVLRLYPVHEGDYSLRALLTPGKNSWQGQINDLPNLDALLLVHKTPLGVSPLCLTRLPAPQ